MKTLNTLNKAALGQIRGLRVRPLSPQAQAELERLKLEHAKRQLARRIYDTLFDAAAEAAAVHPGLFRDGV